MRRFATARLSRSSQRGARYRCGASELTPGQSRRVSGQTGAHRVVANGEKWRGRFAQGLRGMERTGIEPVTSGLQSGGRYIFTRAAFTEIVSMSVESTARAAPAPKHRAAVRARQSRRGLAPRLFPVRGSRN